MIAFLKYTITTIKNNIGSFIFLYLAFPILIVFYFGFLNNDSVEKEMQTPSAKVKIIDYDNSILSKKLTAILKSDKLNSVLNIIEDGDVNYTIKIPKEFQTAVEKNSNIDISITAEKKSSASYANFIASIIEHINKILISNYNIDIGIAELEKEDKQLGEIVKIQYGQLQKEMFTPLGEIKEYKTAKQSSKMEMFAMSFITFLFFLFTMEPAQLAIKKGAIGFAVRLNSLPMSPAKLFISKACVVFIKSFIGSILYIIFFRAMGIGFFGNPLLLFIYAVSFAFICGSFSEFSMSFSNKEMTRNILSILFIFLCIFPQMILPGLAEKNEFAAKFLDLSLINIIYNPLIDISIENSFKGAFKSLAILICTGFTFFIAGISFLSLKKDKI